MVCIDTDCCVLPDGATLLGAILSSDKTNISVMTGDCMAHPLLISLANILADFQLKSMHEAFVLLALLPVAKFPSQSTLKKRMYSLLRDCLN